MHVKLDTCRGERPLRSHRKPCPIASVGANGLLSRLSNLTRADAYARPDFTHGAHASVAYITSKENRYERKRNAETRNGSGGRTTGPRLVFGSSMSCGRCLHSLLPMHVKITHEGQRDDERKKQATRREDRHRQMQHPNSATQFDQGESWVTKT